MITEDYVSFETAELLKENGFDEEVFGYYHIWDRKINRPVWSIGTYIRSEAPHLYIKAPTIQIARKWIREKYNILFIVDYEYECDTTPYYFKIYRLGEYGKPERVAIKGVSYDKDNNATEHIIGYCNWERSKGDYSTYEEACESALKYCLENLI